MRMPIPALKISRVVMGQVLVMAAILAVVAAVLLDRSGLAKGMSPLPFVGTLVCLKLGLFTFWPEISRKRRDASAAFRGVFTTDDPVNSLKEERDLFALNVKSKKPRAFALWDQNDPRLDVSLFQSSVPTFVLSSEQRFLDWNPAFSLIFAGLDGMSRGAHVSAWFGHLDNFRRVPKRTEKLYGEGILPITDRERVTFLSKHYGRMVFTKIMSPVIDRGSGRIIGWTVVLNINSVNKRQEFFEKLFASITLETKRARFAASYDGLFEGYIGRDELIAAHLDDLGDSVKVLELACGTGIMARAMLADGRKVTALEGDLNMLRRLKDKCEGFESRVRIVRQDLDNLKGIPSTRFDAAVIFESLHRFADPAAALLAIYKALKPGAVLSLSLRTDGIDPLYNSIRTHLETSARFDTLKHQFNHVLDFERELSETKPYRFLTREETRVLILAAGFSIEEERMGLQDGHTVLIQARK